MFRRFIAAVALLVSLPTAAQTLTGPPDVGTYVPQPMTYATGTADNVLGDGSNAKGGTAPMFVNFPEVSDGAVPAGWAVNSGITGNYPASTTGPSEKKARLASDFCKFSRDDPIRQWGQPGAAHLHEFFGNCNVNAYSTRDSLRARPDSTTMGGILVATAYWVNAWSKPIGGKQYGIPAYNHTIYYAEEIPPGVSPTLDGLQLPHLKLRFIGGTNMSDPNDCRQKNALDLANGGSGTTCTVTPGRYSYIGDGFHNTGTGYTCIAANGDGTPSTVARPIQGGVGEVHSIRMTMGTADSDDPWYVSGVHGCGDGDFIEVSVSGPGCIDGTNLTSPNGYDHVAQSVYDNVKSRFTCPNHWYPMPAFQEKSFYRTRGWNDYKTWSTESDAMMQAKLTALGTPRTILPGESRHFDWMNGLHSVIRDTLFGNCLGIGAAPHICNSGVIASDMRLISGEASPAASSLNKQRTPQVNGARVVDSNDPAQLVLVDASRSPMHHMKGQ